MSGGGMHNPLMVETLKKLRTNNEDLDRQIKALEEKKYASRVLVENLSRELNFMIKHTWSDYLQTYKDPEDMLTKWLESRKEVKFPGVKLDKATLLNKLKTDLLVNNATTAQEALDSIIRINGQNNPVL